MLLGAVVVVAGTETDLGPPLCGCCGVCEGRQHGSTGVT